MTVSKKNFKRASSTNDSPICSEQPEFFVTKITHLISSSYGTEAANLIITNERTIYFFRLITIHFKIRIVGLQSTNLASFIEQSTNMSPSIERSTNVILVIEQSTNVGTFIKPSGNVWPLIEQWPVVTSCHLPKPSVKSFYKNCVCSSADKKWLLYINSITFFTVFYMYTQCTVGSWYFF